MEWEEIVDEGILRGSINTKDVSKVIQKSTTGEYL